MESITWGHWSKGVKVLSFVSTHVGLDEQLKQVNDSFGLSSLCYEIGIVIIFYTNLKKGANRTPLEILPAILNLLSVSICLIILSELCERKILQTISVNKE